jgi:hypothetical protein
MRSRNIAYLGRILLPLAAMLLASEVAAAPPDTIPQYAGMQANDSRVGTNDGGDNVRATPLPWSQLNPTQRTMFAPLRSEWNQLPPQRQQRMASRAEYWMQLPPERRAQIQQRLVRWAHMTPEQRREAAQGERAFQAMPQADRQRVLDAYQRFKALSPEQRQMLMQRFRQQREARQRMGDQGHPAPPPR